MPVLLLGPAPEYPSEARGAKAPGEVIVRLTVDEKGNPQDVAVLSPADHGFDEKAVEAVRRYKFQPATRYGLPTIAELRVAVDFRSY